MILKVLKTSRKSIGRIIKEDVKALLEKAQSLFHNMAGAERNGATTFLRNVKAGTPQNDAKEKRLFLLNVDYDIN